MDEEREPMWFILCPSYERARSYAVVDHARTGPGHGPGVGPRPWRHISDESQVRGYRLQPQQVHWVHEVAWSRPRFEALRQAISVVINMED